MKSKTLFFSGVLFLVLCSVMDIAFSLLLSQMYTALELLSPHRFFIVAALMLVAVSLSVLFRYAGDFFSYKYICSSLTDIKENFFAESIAKDLTDTSNYTVTAELLSKTYYLNRIYIIYYSLEIIITALVLYFINKYILLYLVLVTAASLLISQKIKDISVKAVDEYSTASRKYVEFLENTFAGTKDIKQYKAESAFAVRHSMLNRALELKRFNVSNLQSVSKNIYSTVTTISFLGLQVLMGILVLSGNIRLAMFITVIQLMNYFVSPLTQLVSAVTQISSVKSLVDRSRSSFSRPEDDRKLPEWSYIKAENLGYKFSSDNVIAYPEKITVQRGKKYAVIGPSGTGKSTLARILSGNLTGYSGNIYLDDRQVSGKELGKMVTTVPQKPHIFFDTVKNNIAMYSQSDLSVEKFLEFMNLKGKISPDTKIGSDTDISGGEKSRVAVARALYHCPQILILDEPTANLDNKNSVDIMRKLCEIKDLTLIVITHEKRRRLDCFDNIIEL